MVQSGRGTSSGSELELSASDLNKLTGNRCADGRFDVELADRLTGASDARLVSLGLTYLAANHLAELRVHPAIELLEQALDLVDHGGRAYSPVHTWWTLNLYGDALGEALRWHRAREAFGRATTFAVNAGLALQASRSLANELRMLRALGHTDEAQAAIERLVSDRATGTAETFTAMVLAEMFDWLGQPEVGTRLIRHIAVEDLQAHGLRRSPSTPAGAFCVSETTDGEGQEVTSSPSEGAENEGAENEARRALQNIALHNIALDRIAKAPKQKLDEATAACRKLADQLRSCDSPRLRQEVDVHLVSLLAEGGHDDECAALLAEIDTTTAGLCEQRKLAEAGLVLAERAQDWKQAAAHQRLLLDLEDRSSLSALAQHELSSFLGANGYELAVSNDSERRAVRLVLALNERAAMTSLVAKDLRSPIFSVGLALQILQLGPNERGSRLLGASLSWLEMAISALTDLDELERTPLASSVTAVNLEALTKEAIERVRPLLRSAEVRTEPSPWSGGELMLVGQRAMIGHVITYALADVALHLPDGHDVDVSFSENGTLIEITVTSGAPSIHPASDGQRTNNEQRRDQFVLQRIVKLLGGSFDDLSLSDADRQLRIWLPRQQPSSSER